MQNIRGQNNIRCYENYFLKQTVNGLRVDSNLILLPPECLSHLIICNAANSTNSIETQMTAASSFPTLVFV